MQDITKKQIDIEYRYKNMKDRELDPEMTMTEVFGPIENWMLEVGRIKYWLNPLNGVWYYLDPIHESWEDSGYKAGEVAFIFKKEGQQQEIKVFTTPISNDAPALSRTDNGYLASLPIDDIRNSTTETNSTGIKNFCPTCGTAAEEPNQKFCTSCGHKLK
ncbi:hypothetical protein ASZ90_017637 [hydrocarbon metagenome]|uniref:Zinc-ribbon domain-containing protein n=1 Tax=hydrocarbon metagenome TaxID=938273 RepID=A0A0W8E8L8_9ZZZZ